MLPIPNLSGFEATDRVEEIDVSHKQKLKRRLKDQIFNRFPSMKKLKKKVSPLKPSSFSPFHFKGVKRGCDAVNSGFTVFVFFFLGYESLQFVFLSSSHLSQFGDSSWLEIISTSIYCSAIRLTQMTLLEGEWICSFLGRA